jgi:hypothetical protein
LFQVGVCAQWDQHGSQEGPRGQGTIRGLDSKQRMHGLLLFGENNNLSLLHFGSLYLFEFVALLRFLFIFLLTHSQAETKKQFQKTDCKDSELVGCQRRYDDETKRRAVKRATPTALFKVEADERSIRLSFSRFLVLFRVLFFSFLF